MNKTLSPVARIGPRGRCDAGPTTTATSMRPSSNAARTAAVCSTDGDFTLELAIFEAGVPPEFHAWATPRTADRSHRATSR